MPPFAVLHVCMGNICRSPMAERMLAMRVAELAGDDAADLVYSHSCGIGAWHVGEPMNKQAARELRRRGGGDGGFRARRMEREHVEASDLILTATSEQVEYIDATYPEALPRTFLLRHLGLLLTDFDAGELPDSDGSASAVYERGAALVVAADRLRDMQPEAELDDPWGLGRATFTRVADEIDAAVTPLAKVLLS